MLDPQTCQGCHPAHFQDWSGSMHAYAAEDPVFLAMNQRGQRETAGKLGTFCVNCHAPMAVREGKTSDGLNLSSLPPSLRGVTCFFCHTVTGVMADHDNGLLLANDTVMRAGYANPQQNSAHQGAYSPLHDRDQADSARLCGSCHDVVTPQGGDIERTFSEWQQSVFSASTGATCSQCHMAESPTMAPIAVYPGAPARTVHAHTWPGVDTALTPRFPQAGVQGQQVQALLDTTLQTALCVRTKGGSSALRVIMENVAAGHDWPSGAAQDRRLYSEVIAYQDNQVIYQSGVVPANTAVTSLSDPDLWLVRDCDLDAKGQYVDLFWQAASFESNLLPTQVTLVLTDPRYFQAHVQQSFPRTPAAAFSGVPDRVTLRVLLEPIGRDVLNDLVQSGDLSASVRDAVKTVVIGPSPVLTWTAATANDGYIDNDGVPVRCLSTTNLNAQLPTFPAANHTKCSP
jgi:hypothetical protein